MVRHGFLFAASGLASATLVVLGGARTWERWALAWIAADLLAVGVAYWTRLHGVFGKRRDGAMGTLNVIAFLPFLLLSWTTWHLLRLLSREPAVSRVAPDLFLARRLLPGEIPGEVNLVIDLTAEFPERRSALATRTYTAFPILDAGVPSPEAVRGLLNALPSSATALIHCAQGHGRTAMIAACLLLGRGHAATVDDAVARVLSARPRARMNRHQRALVAAYARLLTADGRRSLHLGPHPGST